MMRTVLKILLPVVVIAVGVVVAVFMIRSRPDAKRKAQVEPTTAVRVVSAQRSNSEAVIDAMGTVGPDRSVLLQPEVNGVLVYLDPRFEVGGRFDKDEVIARIDRRDYDLAIEQRKAEVERARFALSVEGGRQRVAAHEWQQIGDTIETNPEGRKLALRKPQLASAVADLAAARSGLQRAELNARRTVLRAPFNALVRDRRASVGQLVSAQTPLGTIVGTDRFLVTVSVPLTALPWLLLPGVNATAGSAAKVVVEAGSGLQIAREGRVERLLGEVDPAGRMARLLVGIDRPLETTPAAGGDDGNLPLLLGTYAHVEMRGRALNDVIALPTAYIRDGDKVWLVDRESRLEVRTVEIAWRGPVQVLISGGLTAGDRIITSGIPSPLVGLKLRIEADEGTRPRVEADGDTAAARASAAQAQP